MSDGGADELSNRKSCAIARPCSIDRTTNQLSRKKAGAISPCVTSIPQRRYVCPCYSMHHARPKQTDKEKAERVQEAENDQQGSSI